MPKTPTEWFVALWRSGQETSDELWAEFVKWYSENGNRAAYEAVAAQLRDAEDWCCDLGAYHNQHIRQAFDTWCTQHPTEGALAHNWDFMMAVHRKHMRRIVRWRQVYPYPKWEEFCQQAARRMSTLRITAPPGGLPPRREH